MRSGAVADFILSALGCGLYDPERFEFVDTSSPMQYWCSAIASSTNCLPIFAFNSVARLCKLETWPSGPQVVRGMVDLGEFLPMRRGAGRKTEPRVLRLAHRQHAGARACPVDTAHTRRRPPSSIVRTHTITHPHTHTNTRGH